MSNNQLGKWTVIKQLNRGGNGTIYLVQDANEYQFALKQLTNRNYSYGRQRFLDEINALKNIGDYPGVLPLIDSSVEEFWYVMPLAKPIKNVLDDSPLETIVEAVRDFAETLAYLSEKHGISHRDIKPDNLFRYDERWVIGDFGLVDYPAKSSITASGKKLGPTFYIAPEMLNTPDTADGATADLYSLGKTLWVLATGQNFPIQGEQPSSNHAMGISAYISHPRAYLLDNLIEKTSKFDPNQRISMREFARELSAWIEISAFSPQMVDLSEFAPTIIAANDAGILRLEERNAMLDQFNTLLSRISHVIQPLQLDAQNAGMTCNHLTDVGYLQHLLSVSSLPDKPILRISASCNMISIHNHPSVGGLVSGFILRLYADRSLAIVSAHHITLMNGPNDDVWTSDLGYVEFGTVA